MGRYCAVLSQDCQVNCAGGHCAAEQLSTSALARQVEQRIAAANKAESEFTGPRARILNEAMQITHKDRNSSYGNPEDNFKQIADLWNAYLKAKWSNRQVNYAGGMMPVDSADVAVMSLLIKVARLAKTPSHHDSAVDIAGYAACLGDIQEAMRAQQNNLSNVAGASQSISGAALAGDFLKKGNS